MTLPFTEYELARLSLKAIHNVVIHFPITFVILYPLTLLFLWLRPHAFLVTLTRLLLLLSWLAILTAVITGHVTADLKSLNFADPQWIASAPELAYGIQIHRAMGLMCLALLTLLLIAELILPTRLITARSLRTVAKLSAAIVVVILLAFSAHIGAYLEV